jgi:hypothetical protein
MPMPNLSSMSVDALLKLRDDIGEVLTRRAAQLRDELSKLGGTDRRSGPKGRKVPIKYRDRTGNTWAGRGGAGRPYLFGHVASRVSLPKTRPPPPD